jgi:spermidine synthase
MVAATESAHARPRTQAYLKSSLWLIALCFILSGATGLIYEVLWARMLGLVFGATTFAISAVLAAFMGGLALGSAWAGKLAARIKRPLKAYGLIEIVIALYALAVPFLFRLVDYLYAFIWEQFRPGFYAFNLWRFLLSCTVLIIPTTLMGATLPVLSAALLRSPNHKPTAVTRLYTCNLVGAILGTLAAGFLLLPILGVQWTIYTAAAINAFVGIIAIVIDRRDARATAGHVEAVEDETSPPHATSDTEVEREKLARSSGLKVEGSAKFWLACAVVSGFVTISTQVAWTRVLTMVIGSSTYAFSIVVALFLLGLTLGAYIVSSKRMTANLRRAIMNVEIATAVLLFISIWITNKAPGILIELGTRLEINSWTGLLALQVMVAALLILVPAILMGMVMPLVLIWASNAGEQSVRLVGRSYAVNTLGAITGAFLTGFVLIPKMSTRITILFAVALSLVLAAIAYKPTRENVDVALRRSLAAGACGALILILFIAAPRLNLGDLSKGAYDLLVRIRANPEYSQIGRAHV